MPAARVTTVLVVDDDPDLLELLAFVLQGEGYQVLTATDGMQGLEAVERTPPDLILLDMKMPRMDGWEFARQYHSRHDGRTPIVVLTAAEDARRRALEIGAVGWIGKPFDLEALLTAIRRILGQGPTPKADAA